MERIIKPMEKPQYKFREISADDYEYIYRLKKEAYKEYVELNFGPWDEVQQRGFFERFFSVCKSRMFVITHNGANIGFYNYETNDNCYEIGNICIIPEYRNKGIGTAILQDILSENKDREVHLQYFKQNPVGTLYERLGFERCGETNSHYKMIRMPER